ncbi:potassium channel family protein [Thalassotalea sp. PLHSN55]|uniref:potassium channel family protein n=1 Tax=Thalassotalea sp. PLHSN55 TaxID=3435888 RepID=UPI003F82CF6D
MKQISQDDNFVYLTFALVLLLVGTALAQQFFDHSMQQLMQSTMVLTLVVAVWGVDSKNVLLRQAFLFPVAIIIIAYLGYWLASSGYDHLHLFLLLLFFILTSIQTSRQVMFTGDINGNKILGAICLYLLMGLIWAILYTLMQLSLSHSFSNISSTEWFVLFPDFVYFSFVTITTLGFGDIAPTMPLSRTLVYLEAIVGQFYLAILVASLVGARMSSIAEHRREKHEHSSEHTNS